MADGGCRQRPPVLAAPRQECLVPADKIRRAQPLQRDRSQMRDDLLFGERPVARPCFVGKMIEAGEPLVEMLGDDAPSRVD